jgi:hypothetical protein
MSVLYTMMSVCYNAVLVHVLSSLGTEVQAGSLSHCSKVDLINKNNSSPQSHPSNFSC